MGYGAEELKMIDEKGYTNQYTEMYQASKHFQMICWKTAFEAMRSSRLLGGYQFLQFADTDVYENSNGIVDCFDDENCIKSKDFLKFNGTNVLLAKLDSRLFYGGEEVIVPIKFSNYGEDCKKSADLCYCLVDKDGTIFASGQLKNIDTTTKGLYDICKIKLQLPKVKISKKLTLQIQLTCGSDIYSENEWDIWVYEKRRTISYKEFVTYSNDDIMITDDIEVMLKGLNKGKKVCLVYRADWTRHVANKTMPAPNYAFKAAWNRFKPVIWDRGTNYGGLCDEHRLNQYGFDTGRFYDYNYSVLSEDCDKIILDDFPIEVDSIITGIDKNVRDRFDSYKGSFNLPELMYDRMLRKFSYLFELSVGAGKLLVCGLNMTGLDKCEPSTVAMSEFIFRYMGSNDFNPKPCVDLSVLTDYMRQCAEKPVKERMMTQFWTLDDAPVESQQYWIESREYLLDE